MASPAGKIGVDDFRHWGWLVLMTFLASVLDVVATQVIPALNEAGGSTNAIIVSVLTLVLELTRRWLTDTRKINPSEADKQVVASEDSSVRKILKSIAKKLGY